MNISMDVVVQVLLALSAAVLSIVSAVVGWIVQLAIRKLIEQLNRFGAHITEATAHRAATDVRLEGHDQRLDHHQRWLETHEGRFGKVHKAAEEGGEE